MDYLVKASAIDFYNSCIKGNDYTPDDMKDLATEQPLSDVLFYVLVLNIKMMKKNGRTVTNENIRLDNDEMLVEGIFHCTAEQIEKYLIYLINLVGGSLKVDLEQFLKKYENTKKFLDDPEWTKYCVYRAKKAIEYIEAKYVH